jgi:orotate phosphoribosyltransferase
MDESTCSLFAQALRDRVESSPDCVLYAATIGGLLLAKEVSNSIGVPLLIGRPRAKEVELCNLDELGKISNIILVDDVLTTGGTLRAALAPLSRISGAEVKGIVIAVDRSSGNLEVEFGDQRLRPVGLARIPLVAWDPAECPVCPQSYTNLSDPEGNFISVVLSMPADWAPRIFKGYRSIYALQGNIQQVQEVDRWEPWLPALLEGLPVARVGEDSGLALFIRTLGRTVPDPQNGRVLTDLIGNLLALTHVRVEARSLGCSVLVGDSAAILKQLHASVPVRVPTSISLSNWGELIPYFDALLETDAVFVFAKDGRLAGVKRLVRANEMAQVRGVQLLRDLTRHLDAIGLVVRRGRRAVSVYTQGSLSSIAELSEKTGLWEFTTPKPIVSQVEDIVPGVSSALELILEVAREMVTYGYGGMFVVSTTGRFPDYGRPKLQIEPQPMALLGTRELAEIAKLDGAVLVKSSGEVVAASVIIENREAGAARLGVKQGGARRQAAHRTSVEHPDSVIVCISQNGTIDIHLRGESLPVAEALTGVGR